MVIQNFSFYQNVYNIVEDFKEKNKGNYPPRILNSLSYDEVIKKYHKDFPSLLIRRNKYVGEWLTRYRKMSGINPKNNKFATDNKLIIYGIIFSILKLKNPFCYELNYILTLPGIESNFKFEKLLLRKINNITEICCIENIPKFHKILSNQNIPKKIKIYSPPVILENYLKDFKNYFSFIWADFCSVPKEKGFDEVVFEAMKPLGIFAITESQRQCGEKLNYKFNPPTEYFKSILKYTYQPANMILKIFQVLK